MFPVVAYFIIELGNYVLAICLDLIRNLLEVFMVYLLLELIFEAIKKTVVSFLVQWLKHSRLSYFDFSMESWDEFIELFL